jgi:phosphate transport system permease protein
MAADGPGGLARRLRFLRRLGTGFRAGTLLAAVFVVAVVAAFTGLLVVDSVPSFHHYGLGFFTSAAVEALPALVGTLITSALALLLAVPVALGVAILSAEFAPRRFRTALAYFVDLGAAIPSVVYGFWALEVLAPWMGGTLEPGLARATGGVGPFSGLPLGQGFLTASVILAIMVVPTISALAREALLAVPRAQREAALSLGGTRWDATRIAVLGPAAPGILGAIMLGLGRAIGETIAVALVIGNIPQIPTTLFAPGATIPTLIVNEFGGALGLQQSELIELGLVLLALSFAINLGARLLIRRVERAGGWRPFRRKHRFGSRRGPTPTVEPLGPPGWWAGTVARRPRTIRRRKVVSLVVLALVLGATAAAVVPLVSLIGTAAQQGGSAVVTPSFYTSEPPAACLKLNASSPCPIGGIGPAIQGTLLLVGLGAAAAIPIGLLTGIYLSEYGRGRFRELLTILVDVMVGIPTILLGIFVFAFFLRFDSLNATSALAGASALALLMIPIVARSTEVALRTVSTDVREAALALGFPRHRVTLRVVLGNCKSAIVTGNLLALGRAGGETAALLFTAGFSDYWFQNLHAPTAALGPMIFNYLTDQIAPNYTIDAWGAALVLLLIMAAVSLAARLVLRTEGSVGSV